MTLINIDFSDPKILEKYKLDFLPEYQDSCTYVFEDGIHAFGFRSDLESEDKFICSQGFLPVSTGVFETFGFSTSNFLESILGAETYIFQTMEKLGITEFHDKVKYMNNHSEYYGVADNWEQVLKVKKEFVKSKDKFIMTFFTINREDEPSSGGWRWHKWGEYIGSQNPQHEYIYDDKHIDSIIVYHFHRIP